MDVRVIKALTIVDDATQEVVAVVVERASPATAWHGCWTGWH